MTASSGLSSIPRPSIAPLALPRVDAAARSRPAVRQAPAAVQGEDLMDGVPVAVRCLVREAGPFAA
jgi:hypothetical protein